MEFLFNLSPKRILKPKHIAHRIGRIMDSSKTVSVFKVYVPYRYQVVLSEEDLARVEPFRDSMIKELVDFIHRHATKHGYHLLDQPEIHFTVQPGLTPGNFEVEPVYQNSDDTVDQLNTMVFDKSELHELKQHAATGTMRNRSVDTPILEILEGNDVGMKYDLTGKTISLGRREDNQVVVNDPNVSRYHAKIFFDSKEWRIEDLKSTNGVFLNGKKVKKAPLNQGDEIRMGSTLMKFRIR